MRIHTSLTGVQMFVAASAAGSDVALHLTHHGSRSRAHAFEVKLSGHGARHTRRRNDSSGDYAATWSDWGRFLAAVFERDADAKCWAYDGREAFNRATYGLFDVSCGVTPADLARAVERQVGGHKRRAAVNRVAYAYGLPNYIVTSAIFGE